MPVREILLGTGDKKRHKWIQERVTPASQER